MDIVDSSRNTGNIIGIISGSNPCSFNAPAMKKSPIGAILKSESEQLSLAKIE